MADATNEIAADLGKHAALGLQRVLNLHVGRAEGVLDPSGMVFMLLQIANGLSNGCILYALQHTRDEVDTSQFYDLIAGKLTGLQDVAKPLVLAQLAASREAANG